MKTKPTKAAQINEVQTKKHLLRVPLVYTIIFHSVVFCSIVWLGYTGYTKKSAVTTVVQENVIADKMEMVRGSGYKFVKPLRLTDLPVESSRLKDVKHDILAYLQSVQKLGQLNSASVYLRKLDNGEWISINDVEAFHPGSMFKIPLMMYYLKMDDLHPGYLNRKITYDRPIANPKHETYKGKSLVVGNQYTYGELVTNTIEFSDNISTTLLLFKMDNPDIYQRIFSDLGIKVPDAYDGNYRITARDISKFMRVLYNSTYLSEKKF